MQRDQPAPKLPSDDELLWPALVAVARQGGSASIDEMLEKVIGLEGLSDAQQSLLHGDGPMTEIGYRLTWARTNLKRIGLLANSARGVWTLTDQGKQLVAAGDAAPDDKGARSRVDELFAAYLDTLRTPKRRKRSARRHAGGVGLQNLGEDGSDNAWKEDLLDAVMAMEPSAFERLAQRLLREAGFISAIVTGRTGDGGIDGVGVYRLSLVSFPVFFQCKRYHGSVGAGAVRDFRGAMAGRGSNGLLITTGTFTIDAKSEATRDGAPPVDLIDGERLCDLLKEFEMGVRTVVRKVELPEVDPTFFQEL